MASNANEPTQRRGEDREHQFPRRQRRVLLRLSDQEHGLVLQAARRGGYTMAGYVAEATLAAAAGCLIDAGAGADRALLRDALGELMAARTAVNRFGGNVNQAVTALHASGTAPVWLRDTVMLCRRVVERVDEAVTQVRHRLSR